MNRDAFSSAPFEWCDTYIDRRCYCFCSPCQGRSSPKPNMPCPHPRIFPTGKRSKSSWDLSIFARVSADPRGTRHDIVPIKGNLLPERACTKEPWGGVQEDKMINHTSPQSIHMGPSIRVRRLATWVDPARLQSSSRLCGVTRRREGMVGVELQSIENVHGGTVVV